MDDQTTQPAAPEQPPQQDDHQQVAQHLKARVHHLRHRPEGDATPEAPGDATLKHPQVADFVEGTGVDVLGRFVGLVRDHGAVAPAANPPEADPQARPAAPPPASA